MNYSHKPEVCTHIATIKTVYAEFRVWWDSAVYTANGDRAVAMSLLALSSKRAKEDLDFLLECEDDALQFVEKLEQQVCPAEGHDRETWRLVFEYEEKIVNLLERLERLARMAEHKFDFLKRDYRYDLLYGPHERDFESDQIEREVRMWRNLVEDAHGNDAKALQKAQSFGWKEISYEYLAWRLEKELLFGSVQTWTTTLLGVNGDIALAGAKLGLAGYDCKNIVNMLGLSGFAVYLRHDRPIPVVQFVIYGLRDPKTKKIGWVGQSKHGLDRPKSIITDSAIESCNLGCRNWLRALRSESLKPEIVILESCSTVDELNEAERRHIDKIRSESESQLTNIQGGGFEKTATFLRRSKDRLRVLKAVQGDIEKAANIFGISPNELYDRLTTGEKTWLAELQTTSGTKRKRRVSKESAK